MGFLGALFRRKKKAVALPPAPAGLEAYERLALLGKGGMGEVWRSRRKSDGEIVAVKIIRAEVMSDAEKLDVRVERFRREAQTTASLTSPHAIRIYDHGGTDDGGFYYAMELLEGLDLDKLIVNHGRVREARLSYLMQQACHALGEAHRTAIVHRDIKPENLFVSRTDHVKVLDFGLVKLIEQSSTGEQFDRADLRALTGTAQSLGTPEFMAPEQVRAGATIDHRADIYSLGCVAYHALTGTPLFEGRLDTQLMFAHMTAEPEPPSVRLKKIVHPGIEAVIMRCLEKAPEDRYQTMDELGEAFAAVKLPVSWDADRATAWWDKHVPE